MKTARRGGFGVMVGLLASVAGGWGCAAEAQTDAEAGSGDVTAESEQTSARLGARHGPFTASVVEGRLTVTYREPPESSFLMCSLFPRQPPLALVFVVGQTAVTREMRVSCPRSWGDNVSSSNDATFSVTAAEDAALWDTLFPPRPDGSRWYALRVAARNAYGAWDSRFGDDYRLVLEPSGGGR